MKKALFKVITVICFIFLGYLTLINSDQVAGQDKAIDTSQKITIHVMISAHPWTKDAAIIPMFQELEKKTNVHVEWEQVRNSDGWNEKKSTVLASGSLPDVFFAGLTDGDITSNIDNFYELSGFINKYAPNIKKMFEEMPDTRKISTFPDGKIYSLPNVKMYRPNSVNVMMINKKWLDTLGLAIPKTLDDLEKVLIAFRDKDPNRNGKKDEIPLDFVNIVNGIVTNNGYFSINSLTGSFGVVDDMRGSLVTVQNGKVDFLYAREEYRKLIVYLHRLYSEGLINKEVFTHDYSQMMATSQDPEAAKVGVTLGWSIVDRMGPKWAPQYVILPPLKAKGVAKPLFPANPVDSKMNTNLFEMTKSNKYPERTMIWINEFYGEAMSAQGYYGSFDVGIKKNKNGTYTQLPPAEKGYSQDRWMWTNSFVDSAPMYGSKELENRVTLVPELMVRIRYDNIYKPYYPNPKDIYPIAKFKKSEVDELSLINADISKLVDQKKAEWIVKGGIEKEWKTYLKQLNQIGLPRVKQIYQGAYNRYYR